MTLPKINKRRISELLKQDKRLDSRKPFQYRDIKIETNVSNKAEGSARVTIGKTEVIAGVKMATQTPYTDHADEGTMTTSMELSPICGERYELGPPKINAIEIARVVDRGLRESGFIDWKKLCITPKEKVWSINVDIYCINDDGSVLDASALAALIALKTARFPEYDKETDTINYGEFTDTPLPLTKNQALSMTFYKVGESLILDPNRDEEDASQARLTLAIAKPEKDRIISAMQKGGQTPMTADELIKIIEQSEKNYDKMFPEIETKIKDLMK